MSNRFTRNQIAIVYDFDGTLTPQPMQEYTVLPELGISAQDFWSEVEQECRRTDGDSMLTYMRLLVEKIEANKKHLSREALRELAKDIKYYQGVETWFARINAYVEARSEGKVQAKHYIVSAGLSEILEGISIKSNFERIYASQYWFDHHEAARFPTVVINDTGKTQYLFRINKGREQASESINDYMPETERPIPFTQMLYIGDGMTDVPCMTVVKKYGGYSFAVHKPRNKDAISTCQRLVDADRIDFYAPADYREGQKLERRVHKILDTIIARIALEKERHSFLREMDR
ncbi:MAG: HAD family hydrolase [Pseudomonadota bacterium]